jgi:hypothetical protein
MLEARIYKRYTEGTRKEFYKNYKQTYQTLHFNLHFLMKTDFLSLILAKIRFKVIKAKADAMHDLTGKRYYVVPFYGAGNKTRLLVLCNNDIKLLKKQGILKKSVSHIDISNDCLYYTDCAGKNYGRMSNEEVKENEKSFGKHSSKKK